MVGFRAAYVFDVSQTEGEELPELSERVYGDVGENRDRLMDFISRQGIELEFKENIAPALGSQLRRQDRFASGPVERRGVLNPCA